MSYKCKNCGDSYQESGLKDLRNTFTGKNWISQKGFCSDRCKVEYEKNHGSGADNNVPQQKEEKKGGGFFGFMGSQINNLHDKVEVDKQKDIEEKQKIEGKVEDIAAIQFGTTVDDISNQLSQLVTIGNAKPDKKVKSAIVEKMEFGIMKLKALGANPEADYFDKKLQPLKKKSWF